MNQLFTVLIVRANTKKYLTYRMQPTLESVIFLKLLARLFHQECHKSNVILRTFIICIVYVSQRFRVFQYFGTWIVIIVDIFRIVFRCTSIYFNLGTFTFLSDKKKYMISYFIVGYFRFTKIAIFIIWTWNIPHLQSIRNQWKRFLVSFPNIMKF